MSKAMKECCFLFGMLLNQSSAALVFFHCRAPVLSMIILETRSLKAFTRDALVDLICHLWMAIRIKNKSKQITSSRSFLQEPDERIYIARGASARSKTQVKARLRSGMDERDLGRDEREKKKTDCGFFWTFEDIFSEPVASATREADWLIGNRSRNFRGKHSCTRNKNDMYLFTGFRKSVIFTLFTQFNARRRIYISLDRVAIGQHYRGSNQQHFTHAIKL